VGNSLPPFRAASVKPFASPSKSKIAVCPRRVGTLCSILITARMQVAKDRLRISMGEALHALSPTVLVAVDRFLKTGLGARGLLCRVAQGRPCRRAPRTPSFEDRELRLGKTLVRRFRRHCKQTELLELFQLRGWPAFIDSPFGSPSPLDPENGLSDIVYELNGRKDSRQQIQFCCNGDRVRWEIVGQRPAGK